MLDFVRALTPAGMVRYTAWKLRGAEGDVDLTFRRGGRARLQKSDYGSAYEVFALRDYESPYAPDSAGVRHIVDLGANAGMTVLYWLHAYPYARITAVEPHPGHVARLRANLALNRAGGRVDVRPVAAGTCDGTLALIDAGMSSSVVEDGHPDTIPVTVEDVFARILAGPIDILKIDIEGAEYAILEDRRFPSVAARTLVMEWHRTRDGQGEARCNDVLRAAGYEVMPVFDSGGHGMLWASRRPT